MKSIQFNEVFTPTSFPQYTFIEEHLKDKKEQFLRGLSSTGRVILLSGPSKSGKTVFIEKNIPENKLLIKVSGALVKTDTSQLWEAILNHSNTEYLVSRTISDSNSIVESKDANASLKLAGSGLGTKIGHTKTDSQSSTNTYSMTNNFLHLTIKEFQHSDKIIFIDDFHYIKKELQSEISNEIKSAIENGVQIIIASIPYHSDDAVRANPDLRGRVISLDFDYWKSELLSKIAFRGFEKLNVDATNNDFIDYINKFSHEASGSPQLMQSICLNLCYEFETEMSENSPIIIDESKFKSICEKTGLGTDYSSTVSAMKEGPRVRGNERNTYLLKDGEGTYADVYQIILKAISQNPPLLQFNYETLKKRVAEVCVGDTPSGSSLIKACEKIAEAANEKEKNIVIEWDGDNDVLVIRDPYLLFYLRWSN